MVFCFNFCNFFHFWQTSAPLFFLFFMLHIIFNFLGLLLLSFGSLSLIDLISFISFSISCSRFSFGLLPPCIYEDNSYYQIQIEAWLQLFRFFYSYCRLQVDGCNSVKLFDSNLTLYGTNFMLPFLLQLMTKNPTCSWEAGLIHNRPERCIRISVNLVLIQSVNLTLILEQ